MRVLVFSTRMGADAEYVEAIRRRLPPEVDLDLRMVAVFRPADRRLPLGRYLCVGPALRPGRAVLDFPTASTPPRRAKRLAARRKAYKGSSGARFDRLTRRLVPKRLAKDRALMLASGVRRAPEVHEEFRAADYVVAMDWDAAYAAWSLAQRFPEPSVVMSPEGVGRKLAELAALGS